MQASSRAASDNAGRWICARLLWCRPLSRTLLGRTSNSQPLPGPEAELGSTAVDAAAPSTRL